MNRDVVQKILNILLPVAGIGLMAYYEICDASCSSLRGTFLGIDLKWVGILFMAALLILTVPSLSSHFASPVRRLRTMMLSGALGGEAMLIRFQFVNDFFCALCLAFGLCLLILFLVNVRTMNRYLAGASFLVGMGAFILFFRGTVLPLYSVFLSG